MLFGRLCGSLGLLAIVLMPVVAQAATPLDSAFTETVALPNTGAAGTTAMAWAPDGSGRLFYTRQLGHVNVLDGGALRHFVALSPVYNTSECGVLGLAFDPDFADNHYLYVFVTVSAVEQQIVRYVVDGNTPREPTVIVKGLPTRGVNHNAGGLGFGPDGKLYWAIGDNGNGSGAGDDLTLLAAKISRANLDGSAPADNPFYDDDGPNADLIWARGFRNPFTFTWQPTTDLMWVNTVGNNVEQIFTPSAGDNAGWNKYENNQPAPLLRPIVAYPTNGAGASLIAATGARRAAGVSSFTTTTAHGLHLGGQVTIAGVTNDTFNGSAFVSAVPDDTTFSIAQAGPDASSGGGTITPLDLGNAITGGTFWDSSSVPPEYRGNFFFGDYVSGNIARVTLAADNRVTSVALWEVSAGRMIDMAVGPDGDLYYATFQGGIYHIRYNATEQGIVASQLHLRVAEGGQAVFSVRLATQPTAPVIVAVARDAGDADVSSTESELTFDASNWAVPQAVHVSAGQDDDAAQDTAQIKLSSAGLTSETVDVRVTDDDPIAILASPSRVSIVEGDSAAIAVTLNGAPTVSVDVRGTALGFDLQPQTFRFDASNWSTPQPLVISAASTGPLLSDKLRLSGRLVMPAVVELAVVRPESTSTAGAGGAEEQPAGDGADGFEGAGGDRRGRHDRRR